MDFDPWLLEKIILQFYESGALHERMGLTGDSVYDQTETAVIEKWSEFSDEFKYIYRDKIYYE